MADHIHCTTVDNKAKYFGSGVGAGVDGSNELQHSMDSALMSEFNAITQGIVLSTLR